MRILSGSNANVVMGYLPCRFPMNLSTQNVVTRFSSEDPTRPGGIWYELQKISGKYEGFGKAEDHVVPVVINHSSGAPATCMRADMVDNPLLASINPEYTHVTYQEQASGVRLDEFIRRQQNPQLIRIVVARAVRSLAFMHLAGVAHTDTHLGNFIVEGSRVRLIDWSEALVKGEFKREEVTALTQRLDMMPQAPGPIKEALERHPLDFDMLKRLDIGMFVRTLLLALSDNPQHARLVTALSAISPLLRTAPNILAYYIQDSEMNAETAYTVPTDVTRLEYILSGKQIPQRRRNLFPED